MIQISAGTADGTFVEKNGCISSSRMTASDSVSLPRLDTDGCMSDTPETMGGLSGAPNGTSSQTI